MLTLCMMFLFKGSKIEFMKVIISTVIIDSTYIVAFLY